MQYSVSRLNEKNIPQIEEFCYKASVVGYKNNSSLEKMKFGNKYDLISVPVYHGLFKDNNLICVSGLHPLPDDLVLKNSVRCLFRSAILPGYNVIPGLSKNWMNNVAFSIILPYQIRYSKLHGFENIIATTPADNHDASGKMKRAHAAGHILEKNGIVEFCKNEEYYGSLQSFWKIKLDMYYDLIKNFHSTRERLCISLDSEYYDILNNGF